MKRGRPAKQVEAQPDIDTNVASVAQAYALRIWSGQSPDVPVIERVARVVNGLRGQGMSIDIDLPHPDAAKYLDLHKC